MLEVCRSQSFWLSASILGPARLLASVLGTALRYMYIYSLSLAGSGVIWCYVLWCYRSEEGGGGTVLQCYKNEGGVLHTLPDLSWPWHHCARHGYSPTHPDSALCSHRVRASSIQSLSAGLCFVSRHLCLLTGVFC